MIQDPVLILLAKRLSRRGYAKLPLSIAKVRQSYVVGHKRVRIDGSEYVSEAAKLTFVKSRNVWKLFWKRADLRWHLYETYRNLAEAVEEIDRDPNACFFG